VSLLRGVLYELMFLSPARLNRAKTKHVDSPIAEVGVSRGPGACW
jgi:hypothetical protein